MAQIYQPEEDSYLLSEVLKEILPSLLKKNPDLNFLEIGPGSGIQLETVLKSGVKKGNISALEINPDAVSHCKSLGFNCIKSDLFEKAVGKKNIIIFNAPYLPKNELEPEDSSLATTGGSEGGEIVTRFLSQAKKHLAVDGKIYLLVSSLTKNIGWQGFNKKIVGEKKIFFEKLIVYELTL